MYAESHVLRMPIIIAPTRILVWSCLFGGTMMYWEMVVKQLTFQVSDSLHTFNTEHGHV